MPISGIVLPKFPHLYVLLTSWHSYTLLEHVKNVIGASHALDYDVTILKQIQSTSWITLGFATGSSISHILAMQ